MNRDDARVLVKMPLAELIAMAYRVMSRETEGRIELCSIMNAKSGLCGEDCRFCAQSRRHSTRAPVYPLKAREEIMAAARRAKDIGAHRFDIVTSGNRLNKDEIKSIADSIAEITGGLGMKMCASLGKLDEDDLAMLKRAGLTRYHHNIETSPSYFSNIATTHTFNERVEVIKAARKAGLEVCSGGIIGMGERWDDRIEMAFILRELEVTSVPLNVLVPIKGTPFENMKGISASDAIRTIAIFRVILENKIIKLAAGRESILKDFQAMAFMAGANGMLIGGYLTIGGRAAEEDRRLVQEIEGEWRR